MDGRTPVAGGRADRPDLLSRPHLARGELVPVLDDWFDYGLIVPEYRLNQALFEEVETHLAALEERMGRRLGDGEDPLLVSVRSGAKFSMPEAA